MHFEKPVYAHPLPEWGCDCHVHVFGPFEQFPLASDRSYTPGPASVDELTGLLSRLGLRRVVVVQASPQGTDNRCLVNALEHINSSQRLKARGVAVIDEKTSEAELIRLNNAGVRGVRVNLETSGQHDPEFVRHALQWAAQKVKSLNWHIQIYTTLEVIEAVSDCLLTLPVPVVVDHFGRITASQGADQTGFQNLLKLVASGRIWVKLSAAHRISDQPDCADARFFVEALVRAHPDRMLWGSDWPHTGAWPGQPRSPAVLERFHAIDDVSALQRISQWVEAANWIKILQTNPEQLYQFAAAP